MGLNSEVRAESRSKFRRDTRIDKLEESPPSLYALAAGDERGALKQSETRVKGEATGGNRQQRERRLSRDRRG